MATASRELDLTVEQDPQPVGHAAFLEERIAGAEPVLLARRDQRRALFVGQLAGEERVAEVVGEHHTVSR